MSGLPEISEYQFNEAGTRAAAIAQPQISHRANTPPHLSFATEAVVARKRPGRANGWQHETAGPFVGPSLEAVVEQRAQFISNYMRVRTYYLPSEERDAPPDLQHAITLREKRLAAPATFKARLDDTIGRSSQRMREDPARVHRFEGATFTPQPPNTSLEMSGSGNWVKQLQVQQQWQTMSMMKSRLQRLERRLAEKNTLVEQQAETIWRLRKKVDFPFTTMSLRQHAPFFCPPILSIASFCQVEELETNHRLIAEEIASFVETMPDLKQSTHAAS